MNDDDRCPGTNRNDERCGHPAGWGTDTDSGPCKFHGGASTGAPENNGNAAKHNLSADPRKYKERQDDAETDWIRSVRESILDRMRRQGSDPDFLDRVLAERVASQLHIVIRAQEYVEETGIVQTVFVEDGGYEKDIPNGLVKELRRYDQNIVNNLVKLGVIDDPESAKADAISNLAVEIRRDRRD